MAKNSEKNGTDTKTDIISGDMHGTPLMKQYATWKAKYPDAIMLFRVGDFYETFGADAVLAAKVLGITLTARNNGGSNIELAGFPYHSVEVYLPKLVRAGYRVAVCEQLEKPITGKMVRRGVTEVITPGVTSSDNILEQNKNNFLCAIHTSDDKYYGIALLDISTGEFLLSEGDWSRIEKTVEAYEPTEILYSKPKRIIKDQLSEKFYSYPIDDWVFQHDYTNEKLLNHFKTISLGGFGIDDMKLGQVAAGAILHYLATTENNNLNHVAKITRIAHERFVWLDKFTVRNLELVDSPHEKGKSLLDILDATVCPLGARLMRKWLLLPLKTHQQIEQRLNGVQFFVENSTLLHDIQKNLRIIGDLERIAGKIPLKKINPREVQQLARALRAINTIKEDCGPFENVALDRLVKPLDACLNLCTHIEVTISDSPSVVLLKGGVIRDGANKELDQLRYIVRHANDILKDIENKEIEASGITGLKVGFNNVFGYYIEVTARFKNATIPDNWQRKQTLANAERYITPELKVIEEKIFSAEDKIRDLEDRLFEELRLELLEFIPQLQSNSSLLASLDCIGAFAQLATKNNYARPSFNTEKRIDIKNGRHPVIEARLGVSQKYTPNDTLLDANTQQIQIITGPNMAGKSAYLRQTGIICLMAQIGSFVPAESADVCILEKIFTRVGATDNISSGESTFMVEMNETANIMNNISENNLILLDEIGRGTSTFDGISIAWALAEYLHAHIHTPLTLFATHYHELNELTETLERVKNVHASTKEINNKIIFLHKIVEGGSEHSFGVHVARMAGMPQDITQRATELLHQFENQAEERTENKKSKKSKVDKETLQRIAHEKSMQLNFFSIDDPRLQRIKDALDAMDLNSTTPVELMMKVYEWKKMLD